MASDFSTVTQCLLEARRQRSNAFEVLKENYVQPEFYIQPNYQSVCRENAYVSDKQALKNLYF